MSVQQYIDCLHKDEIMYELGILGISTDAGVSADALRKQIRQVFKLARRGSMKGEPVLTPDVASEITICTPKVASLESELPGPGQVSDQRLIVRLTRRANYLVDRLARITESDPRLSDLRSRLVKILSVVDSEDSEADSECETTQMQLIPEKETREIVVVKDKPANLNSFNLKFDGTSCVRVFVERLEELRQARNVSEEHMLVAFSDLLDKAALHWYRNNKSNFHSYTQLLKGLREDFDIPDLDYKLRIEIMQRTQSRTESIVGYLSTMQGMFSRLTTPMKSEEQLDILMHNIRPEYMKELALHKIDSILTLKQLCKQLELARSREEQFVEPNFNNFRVTTDLNPRFQARPVNRQVSALNEPSTSRSTVRQCFRCNRTNHYTSQCRLREIVCFKCGKKGVRRTECDCNTPKN